MALLLDDLSQFLRDLLQCTPDRRDGKHSDAEEEMRRAGGYSVWEGGVGEAGMAEAAQFAGR